MNLRDAKKHVLASTAAGNAVILKSPPGYGKTDFTFQLFEYVKKANPTKRVGMCRCFLAWQESVDAGGLPWAYTLDHEGKTYQINKPLMPTCFISTEGLPASTYDMVLMVFEEWGQGGVDTKKAFAPWMLEGGVGENHLPEGSLRIALTNLDARDGVTKELDFIIGRRGELPIEGSASVWVEDFADKPYLLDGKSWLTMPATKAWAMQNPTILFEDKPKKQGPWCNPRTLCMWDRYSQEIAKSNGGDIPLNDGNYLETSSGYIGMAATQSLVNTLKFRLELPTYEQVVADPDGAPVPKKADLLMLMAYELAGHALPEHVGECLKYVNRMPKDMSVTYVSALLRRDYRSVIHTPPMQAWVNRNASLLAVISGLS